MHDCRAHKQEKTAEYVCPECGETWFGSPSGPGWLWETAEAREARLAALILAAAVADEQRAEVELARLEEEK